MIRRALPPLMALPREDSRRGDQSGRELLLRDWAHPRRQERFEILLSSTAPRRSVIRRVA